MQTSRCAATEIAFTAHYSDEKALSHAQMLKDYNRELLAVLMQLPMSFSGALNTLIKWTGMKEEDLAEASALSERTIQRLRNNEPNDVSIETVVQLCIGMQLPPQLSDKLMRASGNSFLANERHLMYQFLLTSCYTESIHTCNKRLEEQGFPPLGRMSKTPI